MRIIFFDIGDTLATAVLDGSTGELSRFDVLPHVMETLQTLRDRGQRMGVISNPGDLSPEDVNARLDESGLLTFFDPEIIIYRKKDSPKVFAEAAAQAGAIPSDCIFVGEDRMERRRASQAGLKTVSRPDLVLNSV